MKVAFILPSFAGGGAERVTLNLLAGLDRGRFKPALVVLDGQGPLAALAPADVPVHDLRTPRLRHGLRALVRHLRETKPDAVISSLGYVNVALLALRGRLPAGTRLLVREANLPSLSLPESRWPRLMARAYRRFYRRADAVLCTSERMAGEFARDFAVPEARLRQLANPVDVAGLRHAAARPRRAPGAGLRFVAAGRLTRQKGFDRLLDLIARLPAETHLTILGDGGDGAALAARAASLGLADRVAFPGFDPAPWPHYAGADAFLLPSRWEGMPNAALEALACGTPVIATPESGGIAEVAPQAVRVAAFGEDYLAAMKSLSSGGAPARPRPSLLPARFELAAVCRALETILLETP